MIHTLEDKKARESGWKIKLLSQDDESVVVEIFCPSEERDWYGFKARIPKKKMRSSHIE